MYRRILVPTDGSPGSEQVAAHAASLALETGADLYAIHVVDDASVGSATGPELAAQVQQSLEAAGEGALDRVSRVAEDHGVDVTTELRHGSPHRAIVDYADEVDADVVVMGTHGRRGLERYLLGSVTEHVLRTTDRPVLAVELSGSAVTDAEAAERVADQALDAEGGLAELRDEPYREQSTWVVPGLTESGERVNVHVDAGSGEARVAHLGEP